MGHTKKERKLADNKKNGSYKTASDSARSSSDAKLSKENKKEVEKQLRKEQKRLEKLKSMPKIVLDEDSIQNISSARLEKEAQEEARLEEERLRAESEQANANPQEVIDIVKSETKSEPTNTSQEVDMNAGGEEKQSEEKQTEEGDKTSTSYEQNITTPAPNEQNSEGATSVAKVDLDELKRLQEEIKKERGETDEVIDTHYKINHDDDENYSSSDSSSYASSGNESPSYESHNKENGTEKPTENKTETDGALKSEEPASEVGEDEATETLTQDESITVTEEDKNYREKKEIDKRLKESDNISRVDKGEMAALLREINREKGIVEEDDDASKNANLTENNEKNASKPQNEGENAENESVENEKETDSEEEKREKEEQKKKEEEFNEEVMTLIDDGFYAGEETKLGPEEVKVKSDENLPPEVSQQDNITDEDIESLLKEQEEEAKRQLEEEQEEDYTGMTEEEIAEAKQRNQKFRELKQRYNAKETSIDGDVGDYKKNLDFSINTSIKRFKVKPPKKPFIIAASVVAILMVVAALITYFVLNQPEPPVALIKIELSQPYVTQYVGEDLDLRGIYIEKYYSSGAVERVKATTDMISSKTPNISSDYVITDYRHETFVEFKIDKTEAKRLSITLYEMIATELKAEVYQSEIVAGQELKFENILLSATISYGRDGEPIGSLGTSTVKLDIDPTKIKAFIGTEELTITGTGIVIPEGVVSVQYIKIKYPISSSKFTISENFEAEVRIEVVRG